MKQCPVCGRKVEARRSVALQDDVLLYHHNEFNDECEASRVSVTTAKRLAQSAKVGK